MSEDPRIVRERYLNRTPDQNQRYRKTKNEKRRKATREEKDARNAAHKAWRAENPRTFFDRRSKHYKQVYGVSLEFLNAMLVAQNYLCPCCTAPLSLPPGSDILDKDLNTHVDHLHEEPFTVRGITHRACNTSLGALGDNVNGLLLAVKYVARTEDTEATIRKLQNLINDLSQGGK